jgi:hypothetical protein
MVRVMIDAIESWLTPLLFISAPALMILSTAARYANLHDEIHAVNGQEICNTILLKRAVYFRNALAAPTVVGIGAVIFSAVSLVLEVLLSLHFNN